MAETKTTANATSAPTQAHIPADLVLQALEEVGSIGRHLQEACASGVVRHPALLKTLGVRLADLSDALTTICWCNDPSTEDLAEASRTIEGHEATARRAILGRAAVGA